MIRVVFFGIFPGEEGGEIKFTAFSPHKKIKKKGGGRNEVSEIYLNCGISCDATDCLW
jgi:hypothetical protein